MGHPTDLNLVHNIDADADAGIEMNSMNSIPTSASVSNDTVCVKAVSLDISVNIVNQ